MDLKKLIRQDINEVTGSAWRKVWGWIGLFHRYMYVLFLPCLCFFIPINNVIAKFFIGFMVINWIVEMRLIAKARRIFQERKRIHILLFVVFYLLYLVGLLYSHNMVYGEFDITVKLTLGIFPLLFATFEPEIFRIIRIRYLFFAFVAGCIFAALLCTFNALTWYQATGNPKYLYYSYLSVLHHTSYFAMFLNFAVILVLAWFRENMFTISRGKLIGITLLLLYFTFMIVHISSKMGMITLFVIYMMYAVLNLSRKRERKATLYPIFLAVVMVIMMLISPDTMLRLNRTANAMENIEMVKPDAEESTAERILIWKSSFNIFREHPLFGVGTGEVKDALLAEYKEQGITAAFTQRLDAHNQYIQTTLSLGLVGLLTLLAMLAWPGILAFKRQDYIYLFFIILFGMNILVESMFENQAGVVFYAFFNALLFWFLPGKKNRGLP